MKIGTTDLTPGWHEGLDMAAYLSDPAASASALWKLYNETPAHFLHELRAAEDRDTPPKRLGSLTHTKVFEPDDFESRYVVLGQCEAIVKSTGNRCDKQGSVYRDGSSYCGIRGHDPYGREIPQDPDIECVTEAQRADAIAMEESLRAHPTAGAILGAPGPREVVGVWQDAPTGLWCRIRPDLLIEDPDATSEVFYWSVVNLKTTGRGAGPRRFPRWFNDEGHYFKAAFYRMGLRALWDVEPQNFLYPVVESDGSYEVIVYRLNEDALDIGETEVREAMSTLAGCIETGEWPGYGPAVHDLNLPEWRLRMAHSIDFLEVA